MCNPLQSLSSQALLFPLLVSLEAASAERTSAAAKLMSAIASAHGSLVAEARLVSNELQRVAVLWNERWHAGLEEARFQAPS